MIHLAHLPAEIITNFKSKIDLENLIIEKIRQKEFSYKSISETAGEIGGINRGTVSEYLKGIFFRELCENNLDFGKTVMSISNSEYEELNKRVYQKLKEYLNNLLNKIDQNASKESNNHILSSTYKKMPQKYHTYIEKIVDHYLAKEITIIDKK